MMTPMNHVAAVVGAAPRSVAVRDEIAARAAWLALTAGATHDCTSAVTASVAEEVPLAVHGKVCPRVRRHDGDRNPEFQRVLITWACYEELCHVARVQQSRKTWWCLTAVCANPHSRMLPTYLVLQNL